MAGVRRAVNDLIAKDEVDGSSGSLATAVCLAKQRFDQRHRKEQSSRLIGEPDEAGQSLSQTEYRATCATHGDSETVHCFWVRETTCESSQGSMFLYPYSLITLASRTDDEPWAYYGCSTCGEVTRKHAGSTPLPALWDIHVGTIQGSNGRTTEQP